jgi:hypothetical protein
VLKRRMIAAHPRKELALQGHLSDEYFEMRSNPHAVHSRTLCRGNDADAD